MGNGTDRLMDILTDSPLLIYIGVFFGPFVQEDAAVLGAASLSAANPSYFPTVFFVILAGLFFSDIWKYWIGWAALKNAKARAFAEKKHVADLQDKIQRHTVLTLFGARFLPLARVPAYVACGFFKVPYWKFCLVIFITALCYTVVIFAVCHLIGEAMGEKYLWILPVMAVALIGGFIGYKWLRWRNAG